MIPKRQRGQPQPSRPALGPLPQQRHLGRLEAEREGVIQQSPGLRVAEAKLRGADLQDLARGAQPAQRERRVRPGRDRQPHVRGKMAEHKGDRRVDRLLPHPVIIIQHQHHAAPGRCQLVEQRRQHRAGQVAGSIRQRRQRRLADLRCHGAHRPDHIAPKANPVVVARIQRHPGKHARLRGMPLAQDARLPPPRRRADEHQLAVARACQPPTSSPRDTMPARSAGTCSFAATSTGPAGAGDPAALITPAPPPDGKPRPAGATRPIHPG